jgi:hypothetical protein
MAPAQLPFRVEPFPNSNEPKRRRGISTTTARSIPCSATRTATRFRPVGDGTGPFSKTFHTAGNSIRGVGGRPEWRRLDDIVTANPSRTNFGFMNTGDGTLPATGT